MATNSKILEVWSKVQNNEESEEKFLELIKQKINIREMVLFPSTYCNLSCKHCSYHCKSTGRYEISIERTKRLIEEGIKLGIKLFILVGREPLFDIKRTKQILDFLDQKKVKFGIVTNGTLIEKNINILKNYKFDYFDVSIDGTEKFHDLTRGKEVFKKAEKGIDLIRKYNLTNKQFISSVIMSYNYKNLPEMIKRFSKKGIKNFSLGVYVYTGLNPKEWILTKDQLIEFIDSLKNSKSSAEQIIIDIHAHVHSYWEYLIQKGIIVKTQVKVDKNNVIYYKIPNTKIFLKNSLFTTSFWNSAIITADGFYLDDYEYLIRSDYKKLAIGNVKKKSLKEIIHKVKQKSPKRFMKKISKIKVNSYC